MMQPSILGSVERKSFAGMHCSVAQCLEVVGEWWSMLIVRDAFLGVTRFDQFQERLGISRNILNQRLGNLTSHGVLEKVPYSDHPPRHEYRLTAKGRDLWPVLTTMRQWGDKYAAPDGPPLQMVHQRCGTVFHAEMTCSNCGERVPAPEARAMPGPGDLDHLMDISGK
jgi:DNA-binding HxlR family transcriptional regulator